MYYVFQFYPNLGLRVRVTEHKTKREAIEVINICRNYAGIPYLATDSKGNIFDICTFDLTRKQMAQMIEEMQEGKT